MKTPFQRLFPVAMLVFFGVLTIQLGYGTLRRGSVKYLPQGGPAQILSPDHGAAVFWALSAGMCGVGALLLVAAADLLFRFFRGAARESALPHRPR